MFDETKYVLSYDSANNAIVKNVKFTTAARNVHLLPIYTCYKSLATPVNCIVNDALVHEVPNVQQTFLQFVNDVQLRLMHLLLDVAPYLVIDQFKFGAIRRPQIWRNKSGC